MECNRTRIFIQNDPNTCVVLRKWVDIPKSMEFRCFIRKNKLRAISQYHCDEFFPELVGKENHILQLIHDFYKKNSWRILYEDATMDVAIIDDEKIFLIEFNQFGAETCCGSCLFNWDIDYQLLYHSEFPIIRIRDYESSSKNFVE